MLGTPSADSDTGIVAIFFGDPNFEIERHVTYTGELPGDRVGALDIGDADGDLVEDRLVGGESKVFLLRGRAEL